MAGGGLGSALQAIGKLTQAEVYVHRGWRSAMVQFESLRRQALSVAWYELERDEAELTAPMHRCDAQGGETVDQLV